MKTLLLGLGLGAVLEFLLDPRLGRRRRALVRDRVAATARRGWHRIGRIGRKATSDVAGMGERITHLSVAGVRSADDAALKARVETELFRDPEVPKGRININVEDGVVVLRGELDRPGQITAIVAKARTIPGVADVESLLHLKGTRMHAS
jgi:osmotically-inducible protein OsmY